MLVLTSDPKNISRIEKFVQNVFLDCDLCPEIYGNILISLTEAVTNAILHGNNGDSSKTVEIRTERFEDSKQVFYIKDQGAGFNYKEIPDPTSQENILKIGGRGVFLMRELSDRLKFHDNGCCVEIDFNLQPPA